MKLMPKLSLLIKQGSSNNGYTLTELLIGLSLSSIIVSAAGFGLVNTFLLDQKASAKGTIQYNANRSLEFITDEVKLGRKVEADAVAALDEAPDFTLPDGAKPILVIQVPDVPQRVIYFTEPATDVWFGPKVVKRWGAPLDLEGKYDPTKINNPENWESHVLIDNIEDSSITPNCPEDWQLTNPDAVQGFNACVDPEERLVRMNLATTTSNPTWKKDLTYQVESMAFTRSNVVQGFSENAPSFTISNQQLVLDGPANIRFEVLGGDIACYAGGPQVPVATNLYVDGSEQSWDANSSLTLSNQPAGTTFDVESVAGVTMCGRSRNQTVSSSQTDNPQLKVLINGDDVPDYTPFGNQNTIESFMQQYVKDGKIDIADNQAIYLFELWGNNQSASYFDLQDNVVLATVENAD